MKETGAVAEGGGSTGEILSRRYHTLTGRPDHREPATRRVIFKAFARTLGPWLPADREVRVLDAGCGEGALLAFLRERGFDRLAGFDLSPENVGLCHAQGFGFVTEGDALKLAEVSGEYDAIFSLDLLEHLPKERAAEFLGAARGKLAPGGVLILQTPNMGYLLAAFHRYSDLTHQWGVTEVSVRVLLRAAGFDDARIEIRPAWNATTLLGRLREAYLRALHLAITFIEGSYRPRIPTKNLLVRARR
ncbi:MAG: class I SAM-dependent methyltransferase [Candidatus Coatesbacteria bacterium]